MLIRPAIEALRSSDAPQRRASLPLHQAIADWFDGPGQGLSDLELAEFAAGTPVERLPRLGALFAAGSTLGRGLIDDFNAMLCRWLAASELDLVSLRHFSDDLTASLMLARHHEATLTLQVVNGPALARRPAPVSVPFMPGETHDLVLAGSAEVEVVTLAEERPGGARLETRRDELRAGAVHHRFGSAQAVILRQVPTSLVTLKLQRRIGQGAVTREYLLTDGSLVHQAAGCSRDSRLELTAALLGRMKRADAAPLLAAMAEEHGAQSLRWQALRECLALDTATGLGALSTIAARADDPLAAPAVALRGQLLETYPALRRALGDLLPCPA